MPTAGSATFDAIFSGYLPSAGHVEAVAAAVKRLRELNPASPTFAIRSSAMIRMAFTSTSERQRQCASGCSRRRRFDAEPVRAGVAVWHRRAINTRRRRSNLPPCPPEGRRHIDTRWTFPPRHRARRRKTRPYRQGREMERRPARHRRSLCRLLDRQTHAWPATCRGARSRSPGVKQALEVSRGSDHLLPNLMDWINGISPVDIEAPSVGQIRGQPP